MGGSVPPPYPDTVMVTLAQESMERLVPPPYPDTVMVTLAQESMERLVPPPYADTVMVTLAQESMERPSFQTCTMGSMACRSMSADRGEEVV
ncbi:unnamed protein product [Arctogadus glacialis]